MTYKLAQAWVKAGVPVKAALTNLASLAATWQALGRDKGVAQDGTVEVSPSYEELFRLEESETELVSAKLL